MTGSKELSVIIPCYNAGRVLEVELPLICNFLKHHFTSYEIILSDDGSSAGDTTKVLAQNWGCRYVKLPSNTGKGAAVRKGFECAEGNVRVFIDSDLPFDFKSITEIYDLIHHNKADIVIGDRTNPLSSYYMEISWLRKMGSQFISAIAKRLLKNDIIDTQCGLKGFSSAAAKKIFPACSTNGFGIDFELLYLAGVHDLKIQKIPVSLRTQYPSTVNVYKDGLVIIKEIIRTVIIHGKYGLQKRR